MHNKNKKDTAGEIKQLEQTIVDMSSIELELLCGGRDGLGEREDIETVKIVG